MNGRTFRQFVIKARLGPTVFDKYLVCNHPIVIVGIHFIFNLRVPQYAKLNTGIEVTFVNSIAVTANALILAR